MIATLLSSLLWFACGYTAGAVVRSAVRRYHRARLPKVSNQLDRAARANRLRQRIPVVDAELVDFDTDERTR